MTKAITPEQAETRLMSCEDTSKAAELLPCLTVVQLRRLAKERKVILPRTVRRKADIIAKLLHELFPPSRQIKVETKKWPEIVVQPRVLKLKIICPMVNARSRLRFTSRFLLGLRQPRYRKSMTWVRPP